MRIAIEGCIGCGKTTTATLLAKRLGCSVLLEDTNRHPFIERFYENPSKYAIETELSFLLLHYHQLHHDLSEQAAVLDYSIAKDLVFAEMNLTDREMKVFKNVYDYLLEKVGLPHMVIFLDVHVDELLNRISGRGRRFESAITKEYLQSLLEHYLKSVERLGAKVVVIPIEIGIGPEEVVGRILTALDCA